MSRFLDKEYTFDYLKEGKDVDPIISIEELETISHFKNTYTLYGFVHIPTLLLHSGYHIQAAMFWVAGSTFEGKTSPELFFDMDLKEYILSLQMNWIRSIGEDYIISLSNIYLDS